MADVRECQEDGDGLDGDGGGVDDGGIYPHSREGGARSRL